MIEVEKFWKFKLKNFLLHDAGIWNEPTVQWLVLIELLDTHCEFYENTYSYELWKLDLNNCDPTSYWWFEGFCFWISLNICLRFILTINGILFGLNLYNICLHPPHTHTHIGKRKDCYFNLSKCQNHISYIVNVVTTTVCI